MRQLVFAGGGVGLKDEDLKRRRGRPRQTWAGEIHRIALQMSGSLGQLESAIANEKAWKEAVRSHCRNQ